MVPFYFLYLPAMFLAAFLHTFCFLSSCLLLRFVLVFLRTIFIYFCVFDTFFTYLLFHILYFLTSFLRSFVLLFWTHSWRVPSLFLRTFCLPSHNFSCKRFSLVYLYFSCTLIWLLCSYFGCMFSCKVLCYWSCIRFGLALLPTLFWHTFWLVPCYPSSILSRLLSCYFFAYFLLLSFL